MKPKGPLKSPYRRAWRDAGLVLALMVAAVPAVALLGLAIGEAAYPVVFLLWLALAFRLGRRVKCPGCGTSLFVFGFGLAFSKPWPNARCARCGYDLKRS
ncbi:MAG: hypothetical protein WBR13_00840 [Allosphingosinicella sp.]